MYGMYGMEFRGVPQGGHSIHPWGRYIVVLSPYAHPRWHSSVDLSEGSVPPNSNPGGDGKLDILAIAFLGHSQCNKDQLYLFEIANSHGYIGEHVRGDIKDWLKL